jgi:CBS domain-containing protein
MRIRDFMTRDAVCIAAGASAANARQALRLHEVEHLIVMDGKRIAGVIARQDLAGASDETPVRALMTRHVVTIEPAATLRRAAAAMAGHGIGCLPVVDGERLIGIVTTSDLLGAIAKGELHAPPPPERTILRKRGPRKRPAAI